jgi:outer membrane protein assembly factor BamB
LIYVAAGPTVYALRDDGAHASVVWTFTAGAGVLGLAIGDGVLYATAKDQRLYAIEDDPTAGP